MTEPSQVEELTPEVHTDITIDDEVDTRVEDAHRMSNKRQTFYPSGRKISQVGVQFLHLVTVDNILQVGKLIDINNNPWYMTTKESNHDTEQDDEHILLTSPLFTFRSISVHLRCAEIKENPHVKKYDCDQRYYANDEHSEVQNIVLDVGLVLA